MIERTSHQFREIDLVQNQALGAAMIWRFGLAFQRENEQIPPPLLLTFLVLPVGFHRETLDAVLSTRLASGLALFAEKVGERREDLLGIHTRALALRSVTLQSIAAGIGSNLFTMLYREGRLRSNSGDLPPIIERIKPHIQGAERLGAWCARLPLNQIASALRIDF
jgi:hypothetical protein